MLAEEFASCLRNLESLSHRNLKQCQIHLQLEMTLHQSALAALFLSLLLVERIPRRN